MPRYLDRDGVCRLSRFELIHISSMLVLQQQEYSLMTPLEAKKRILSGKCPLLLQRKYTDGCVKSFRILDDRKLMPIN